jgi:hypothetical protein
MMLPDKSSFPFRILDRFREELRLARLSPDEDLISYIERLTQERWLAIRDRKVIYLDSYVWIGIRNAALNPGGCRDIESRTLSLLREKVAAGLIICPCSYHLFCELISQTEERRLNTARLMDELSLGYSFVSPKDMRVVEIRHHFLSQINAPNRRSIRSQSLTRIAWVWGTLVPSVPIPDQNLALQKAFYSSFGDRSLYELFAAVDFPRDTSDFDEIAESIQDFIRLCSEERLGFEEARNSAAAGMFDAMNDDVASVSREVFLKYEDYCMRYVQTQRSVKISASDIPSIAVSSAIYADFAKASKNMNVKRNDYFDVEHATLALSYCDFATFDVPMARRLRVPPVRDYLPKTSKILGGLDELLEVLQGL